MPVELIVQLLVLGAQAYATLSEQDKAKVMATIASEKAKATALNDVWASLAPSTGSNPASL